MPPRLRKFALTAHVVSSVGWLGAVGVFLALAVAGLVSADPELVRAVHPTMDWAGWFVLVPVSVASLLTGLVMSLGTSWGLLGHYWVLFKLLINVFATIVLLMYTQTLGALAERAAATAPEADLGPLRSPSPLLHAAAALLLLLVATTLAVHKPRGLTPYGQRKLHQRRKQQDQRPTAVR